MNEQGAMLIFRQEDPALREYLNSLYKESADGEPIEPVVKTIQTVTHSGRKVGVINLGKFFRQDTKVVKLIVDGLIKMNMPVKIESGAREVESEDFSQYLEQNDKVLIIATREGDGEPLIMKYGGREFKKKVSQREPGQMPEFIRWLEAKAICPETIIFDVHSPPWRESEAEDIAYAILQEISE